MLCTSGTCTSSWGALDMSFFFSASPYTESSASYTSFKLSKDNKNYEVGKQTETNIEQKVSSICFWKGDLHYHTDLRLHSDIISPFRNFFCKSTVAFQSLVACEIEICSLIIWAKQKLLIRRWYSFCKNHFRHSLMVIFLYFCRFLTTKISVLSTVRQRHRASCKHRSIVDS